MTSAKLMTGKENRNANNTPLQNLKNKFDSKIN